MTDELFDVEESLSPRLRWMRENRIETQESDLFKLTGHGKPWAAYVAGKRTKAMSQVSTGDTEDEAIVALAKKLNLKLWNEEPQKPLFQILDHGDQILPGDQYQRANGEWRNVPGAGYTLNHMDAPHRRPL